MNEMNITEWNYEADIQVEETSDEDINLFLSDILDHDTDNDFIFIYLEDFYGLEN